MTRTFDQPTYCKRCQTVIPAGEPVYVAEVKTMGGQYVESRSHPSRAACDAAKAAKAAAQPVVAPAPVVTSDRATARQVSYAASLQRTVGPYERRSLAELAAMSRSEISRLISIMESNG